jgi:glycosyltransferase involved in cell wall biosynthesis
MKILLVNKFHYLKGGSETYYFGLDEMLRAHGHQVIHFAMQDNNNLPSPTADSFITNVDFNSISGISNKLRAVKNMFYSREAYDKMKKLLKEEKPDIVHLGLVHKQITYSIIDAIKEFNIPIVQSVHDPIFVCPNYMLHTCGKNCEKCVDGSPFNCTINKCVDNSFAKSLLSSLENKYIKKHKWYDDIDLFITECRFYEGILKRAQFTNSEIKTIVNFLPPSKTIVNNLSIGDYFLFFGRFSVEKGIITLIKAHAESNVNIPLVLVGGGPEEAKIKQFVSDNGLQNRVIFQGYVYGEKMVSLLDKARAVIVPSEWYECCPYSIIEAMARSRIVIASNVAGLPELVKDKKTGYLFESQDVTALASVLKTVENLPDKTIEQMEFNTYNYARSLFDAESYYQNLFSEYKRLIKNKEDKKCH